MTVSTSWDGRGGMGRRILLAVVATALVAIPFTILLLAVVTRSDWLARLDSIGTDQIHAQAIGRPAIVAVLRVVSTVTQPTVLRVIALVAAIVLWRRGRTMAALWLGVTMAVGGILAVVLKELVQRARPELADAPFAGGYSFPSGHALNSMLFAACAVVLLQPHVHRWRRAVAWTAAAAFVLLVGYDRIALGVHYISDVLAGWVVALATAAASLAAFGMPLRAPGTALAVEPDTDRPAAPTSRGRRVGAVAVRLVPGWIAIWAVLVGLGLLLTRTLDGVWPLTVEDQVNITLAAGRTPLGNDVSSWMSALGNTSTIVVLCLAAAVALRWWLGRWRESLFVVLCTLGQSLVFFFTTLVIDRERPEVDKLDESPPTSSFPSGHTSASIALYVSLAVVIHRRVRRAWLRRVLVVLLASGPVLVGLARLYRGMHHPSDLAGAVVNSTLVILVTDRAIRAGAPADQAAQPVQPVQSVNR